MSPTGKKRNHFDVSICGKAWLWSPKKMVAEASKLKTCGLSNNSATPHFCDKKETNDFATPSFVEVCAKGAISGKRRNSNYLIEYLQFQKSFSAEKIKSINEYLRWLLMFDNTCKFFGVVTFKPQWKIPFSPFSLFSGSASSRCFFDVSQNPVSETSDETNGVFLLCTNLAVLQTVALRWYWVLLG